MIRAYKGSTVTQRAKSKGKDLHPNREGNGTARQELRKKEKKKKNTQLIEQLTQQVIKKDTHI